MQTPDKQKPARIAARRLCCFRAGSARLAAQERRNFELIVFMRPHLRRSATVIVELAATRRIEAGFRRKRPAVPI